MIQQLEISRKHDNRKKFLGKQAVIEPQYEPIGDSCILNLEDNKPMAYFDLDDPAFDYLIPHLRRLKYNPSNRKATGKDNQSILVGGITPRTNRTPFCNVGSLLDKDEELHYVLIEDVSEILSDILNMIFPQWHKVSKHFFENAGIHSDFQMSASFWTSAIINYNSQQVYHLDVPNLKNTFSAMLTFKFDVSGGYLVLPEYETFIKTRNRSLTFFYGKDIVHGVSPIEYHSSNAYRYTIVFYTMHELSKCASIKEEFKKA